MAGQDFPTRTPTLLSPSGGLLSLMRPPFLGARICRAREWGVPFFRVNFTLNRLSSLRRPAGRPAGRSVGRPVRPVGVCALVFSFELEFFFEAKTILSLRFASGFSLFLFRAIAPLCLALRSGFRFEAKTILSLRFARGFSFFVCFGQLPPCASAILPSFVHCFKTILPVWFAGKK